MKNTALVIALIFFFAQTAQAESQFSVSPTLMHFDYTEFSFDGSVLDSETGWIPGIQLLLAQNLSHNLNIEFEASTYAGGVDYAGYTQSGLPHNTRTNEEVIRLGVRLVAPVLTNTDIYLTTKYHQWDRNILSNNGIAGLFEQYQWWEISAGTRILFFVKDNQKWMADLAILRTINPGIHVDLSSINAGKTDLDLGADTGARLQLMWMISGDKQYTYGINAFYEIWEFGVSDSKVTRGGSSSFSVFEPSSETRHSGIQLQLNFNY